VTSRRTIGEAGWEKIAAGSLARLDRVLGRGAQRVSEGPNLHFDQNRNGHRSIRP
jgi:hypothetical protein